jgi:isopenicillin-N epimerase
MEGMAPESTPSHFPPVYGRTLRPHFNLDPAAVFLNHGSFGLTPLSVLAAQQDLRAEMESQPVQFLDRTKLQPRLRAAAARLAQFLGAAGADTAFVDNATTGINAVLRSLVLRPGDEVLLTDHTYGAVRKAVSFACARAGARMVEVRVPVPVASADEITAFITAGLGERTRLAVLDLVTSASAIIMPVTAIIEACRVAGVRVIIDAAHAPGMLDLDLPALGADWMAGNAHKWLFTPKGCGFLWARAEAQADLHPTVISHGYGEGFLNEFDWTGTRDPTAWLAVPAALDFYAAMGGPRLRARNHGLAVEASSLLARRWRTEVAAPPALLGSMATVRLPATAPATVEVARSLHDRLWHDHRIEAPVFPLAGGLWVRISAQIYNELADYQRLADAVIAM